MVVVKIAGTRCNVTSVTDTEIVCITGQHSPSQKTNVWVEINGNGMATQVCTFCLREFLQYNSILLN